MNIRIEVVCVSADGREQRRQLSGFERQELAMETLGMSLAESKTLLEGVQDFMVAQTGQRESGATTCVSPLRSSVHDEVLWKYARQHPLRPGECAKSAVEPMRLPDRRPGNIPADGSMAPRANQRRNALLGEQVGVVDPLRKGGGLTDGSIADRELHQS